jgi:orotidine-5'-phosphate decarboxylase
MNGNICFVVGATYPSQMSDIRRIAPDTCFLVPGVGTQGGSIKEIMTNGVRRDGSGLIISSSRSIIHASEKDDFAERAKDAAFNYFTEIQQYRRS